MIILVHVQLDHKWPNEYISMTGVNEDSHYPYIAQDQWDCEMVIIMK